MKKNILFVMNNLHCGGAEKALISLLETMDYNRFNVDLFLFKHEGLFFSKTPKQVILLPEPSEFQYFDMSAKAAVAGCLKKGRVDIAVSRIQAGFIFRSEKNRAKCEQRVWKPLSRTLKSIDKTYDIAVGFLEKNPIYFCVEKVHALKKIGFIHNDYDKLGMDPDLDEQYFDALDHIVSVSESSVRILQGRFPHYRHKIALMHNIVSPNIINKLSFEDADLKRGGFTIVSVGRLHPQKGFDMAIEACGMLIREGYDIRWLVIGEGNERMKLEKMIEENHLQQKFILLGMQENPYPYIRMADLYVQPSRFEGKPVAIDEAKILCKPIVATNFSTVKDQIIHNENGLIVDMTPEAISEGIKKLIEDQALRNAFVDHLSREQLGTETEIHKFYQLCM
ncbi:glycosyltransferase [Ferviditalea candida]|uniref:Glycosyltransferase n=1 Tax=Ferviditalea candida TaxID=3108399 RepID=A0ABU5ZE46_9BACL|nr:glycosyltransferase [Paenibacillaceae bacterium T2]